MSALVEVPVAPASPERFRSLIGEDYGEIEDAIATAQRAFAGRVIWHVNSTARGGGVAEMLQSLLAYARGAGADVRWLTIRGGEDFFRVTKRIHNNLHGAEGDGGELGRDQREAYDRALIEAADELTDRVREGDVVYLHDPQTAGLAPRVKSSGVSLVWRCHVGLDHPNEVARRAWEFLRPYLEDVDAYVFSRKAFVWEGLEEKKLWLVAPSIDAFSPKNQDLEPEVVRAILAVAGIAEEDGSAPVFERQDGSRGRVDRQAELDQEGAIPSGAPLLAQVSRWDRLKDPQGVLRCFAEHVRRDDVHLLLAGPSVADVSDDPEGAEVLAEIRALRSNLPEVVRSRVHLATLPMDDIQENAAIVNAIQRRADIVIQKSIAEGFGLTVAEAMWKGRPVVASRIGGIQDQIVNGESGLLVDDPTDLAEVGAALDSLLAEPRRAEAIGAAARERVRGDFLGSRHLAQYTALLARMLHLRETAE